ncbi:MAG: preprotein translocase subunit SecG [Phycisphaerae bacterium]|nr:preprotein translocase subunit SecG [Phycisphaerae bacterium]
MQILALPVMHYVLATLFIVVCLLLMLVVLIQKGRGGGLSGAFGGVGGHSAFGAKTGDVFTWITVALAAGFLCTAVWLNYVYVKLDVTVDAPAPVMTTPGGEATDEAMPADEETPATPESPAAPENPTP